MTALADRLGLDKGTNAGDWGIGHRYTEIYESFLRPRVGEPLRILEIGVWKGGSLRMWEEYFPNAKIVGIDILSESASAECGRAKVLIGDASDPVFLLNAVDEYLDGSVDVVIDDGSHILEHQVVALESLFPRLNERGLYFVEDISVSRFDSKGVKTLPFRDFLDYAFALAELTTFFANYNSETYHTIADVRFVTSESEQGPEAGFWNLNLFALHIFHNMCVFERRARTLPESVRRPNAGAAPLRPAQGNAYAYRRLVKSLDEARPRHATATGYTRSIAAALDSLQQGWIDIVVGQRLLEAGGSVARALEKLVRNYERMFLALRQRLIDIRRDTDDLAEQYGSTQAALTRALGSLNKREAELERMQNNLTQERQRQETLAAELSEERGRNEAVLGQLEALRGQNQVLEDQNKALGDQNKALGDQNKTLRLDVAAISAESEKARTQWQELDAAHTASVAGSEKIRAGLEEELAKVRQDFASAHARLAQREQELEDNRAAFKQVCGDLQAIHRSRLWRMIQPLRAVDDYFRERRRRKKRERLTQDF